MVEHAHHQLQVIVFRDQQGGVLGAGVWLHQADQFPGHAFRAAGAFHGLVQQFTNRGGLGFFPEYRLGPGRAHRRLLGNIFIRNELGLEIQGLGARYFTLGPFRPPASGGFEDGEAVAGRGRLFGQNAKAGRLLRNVQADLGGVTQGVEIHPGFNHPYRALFAGHPGNAEFQVAPGGNRNPRRNQQEDKYIERSS